MLVEFPRVAKPQRELRLDKDTPPRHRDPRRWAIPLALILTSAFFCWGSLGRELSDSEARLALAAVEAFGPHGKVFGGWEPGVRPGGLAISTLLARIMGPDAAYWPSIVHLPALLAVLLLAGLASRTISREFGTSFGLGAWFALLGCVAWIDRSPALGVDPWSALVLLLFTDQILQRGSTWIAGAALGVGFLLSGLPPVILGLLVVLVLGRRGAYLNHRLVLPPLVAIGAWSAWALSAAPATAWAIALLGPFKTPISWGLVPAALGLALPWTPMLLLLAWPKLRRAWTPTQADRVKGWSQAAVVAALAGSLLPGFGSAALSWLITLLVILAVVALGSAFSFAREPRVAASAGWLGAATCAAWAMLAIPSLTGLAGLVAYYRPLAITLAVLAATGMAYAAVGAWTRRRAWVLGGLVSLAVGLKLAHSGIYIPEWDYRAGQGPWGRAFGQWVPPLETIHVFHAERADLMHATGRPVRQLVAPAWLDFLDTPAPHYVLLLASEFEHWPAQAPAIEKLRSFEDLRGTVRILARTTTPESRIPASTLPHASPPPRAAFSSSPLTPNRRASSSSTSDQATPRDASITSK